MNIEELTKSQIFLLTVLTSVVTSMATGIVTVALMDQAPPTITQSVSRVIQATVEQKPLPKGTQPVAAAVAAPLQIAPEPTQKAATVSEVVHDFLPSFVRLYDDKGATFVGTGAVLDEKGTILIDGGSVTRLGQNFTIVFMDGSTLKAAVLSRNVEHSLALLVPATASSTMKFSPATLSKDTPALGESVIALSGKTGPRIASGLVVAAEADESEALALIETNINTTEITGGAPLITMDGALAGVSTMHFGSGMFIPASIIAADYAEALASKSAQNQGSDGLKEAKNGIQ